MHMPSRAVAAAWVLTLLGAGLVAQQPTPGPDQQPPVTFKLEVNYVEVDTVVTDADGKFVEDLTLDDFDVLEDGEVQEVTTFSVVNIPVERAVRPLFAERPIEPDVSSNARPFDGRVYVLTLDDLHTAPLRSSLVKAAGRQFIERYLGANDLTAVVYTSGRSDASQNFTSNRRLLLASVDKFIGQGVRSSALERADAYFRTLGSQSRGNRLTDRVNDPLDFERGQKARSALITLRELAEWLGGVRGRRKAVVFLSEGIDYDIYDFINARYATTVTHEVKQTIAAATQANVSFYTIDPRGLVTLGDDVIEAQILPDDPIAQLSSTDARYNFRIAQDSLQVLAEETGGMAFLDSNDFADAFARIVRDNSSYYVLGYYPSNDRRDGRFRNVEVRVKRPRVAVRARRGYLAPQGDPPEIELAEASRGTSDKLRAVMSNPIPVSGLTLSVSAMPFMAERPNASVAVAIEIDGRDLTFVERGDQFEDTVELSLTLLDEEGKIRGGESQTLELELQPATHAAVSTYGLRVVSRFEVEPGRYLVRVAVREREGGSAGSVQYDLDVPDFTDEPLVMSGMAIASAAASRTPTARSDPEFKDVLPTQPTTQREFVQGDELFLFVEIYDNESAAHRVDISTLIQTDAGRVLFQTDDERSSTELHGARGGYGHVARIPLADLTPGLYVLRTEARSRLDPDSLVFREVPFRIRDPRLAQP